MTAGTLYAVVWRSGGCTHVLDCDDDAQARAFARELGEAGREDVLLTGPREVPVDAEREAAVRERILRVVAAAGLAKQWDEAAGGQA